MKRLRCMLILCCGMVLLAACAQTPLASPPPAPPAEPIYVLSGKLTGSRSYSGLTIVDRTTWTIHHQVGLPRSRARYLTPDPQGHLWVGLGGDDADDNRVRIYAPDGSLHKELHLCDRPEAGISFAAGRAFVACQERGFVGRVAVVDLETLEVVQMLDLPVDDSYNFIFASAATEEAVVVTGRTEGDDPMLSLTAITLIDPHTLTITAVLAPVNMGTVRRIIPHDGHFYLLNSFNWDDDHTHEPDILVLEPGNPPTLTPLHLAPAPLWGDIDADTLYTYHELKTSVGDLDAPCLIGRLHLTTGVTETWELPNGWGAGDLAVVNGEVLLARMWGNADEDGLYRFDPESGEVTLLVNIPDASSVVGGK